MTVTSTAGARTLHGLRPVFSAGWHWIFLAQLASVAGTWAVVKTVSNVASVPEFGQFGIMLAVAFAVNALLFGPLAAWTQRHFQEAREAGALREYYRVLGIAAVGGTLLGGVLPFALAAALPRLLGRVDLTLTMVGVALTLGLVISYSDVAIAIANSAFHRRSASFFLVTGAWLRVAAVLIAFLLGAHSATAFAVAIIVALALMIPVQAAMLARGHAHWERGENPPSFLPSLGSFLLPLMVWGLPGYILSFGDRLLLAYYTSPAIVGVYVAMTAATINVGYAFAGAANRVLEPTIYSVSGGGTDPARTGRALSIVRTTTALALLPAIPLLAVYAIWPKTAISFFSSAAYTGQSQYLWLLLLSTIVFLVGQQLMLHGLVVKRPWVYVPIKFVHAAVLATLLIVLVPRDGLPGVVWSLLAAHTLQLLMVAATNRFSFRTAPEVVSR